MIFLRISPIFAVLLGAGLVPSALFGQDTPAPCYYLQNRRPDRIGTISGVQNIGDRVAGHPQAGQETQYLPDSVASFELISVIGAQLRSDSTSNVTTQGSEWPLKLAGVELLVDGRPAPLYYVGLRRDGVRVPGADSEIIAQLPELSAPTVTLQVRQARIDGRLCVGPEAVRPVSGSALSLVRDGSGRVYVDGSVNDRFTLYGFGLGELEETVEAGRPVTKPLRVKLGVSITVGNQPAELTYAGAVPGLVGVYQINAEARPQPADQGTKPEVTVKQGMRQVSFTAQ